MKKRIRTAPIILFLSMACLIILIVSVHSAQKEEVDIGQLIRDYNALLTEKKKTGSDLSAAEMLDHQSREAMAQGNPGLAAMLLEDAIRILKDPLAGLSSDSLESNSFSSSDFKTVSTVVIDDISWRSPFGIFGPYQFALDSKKIMNRQKINAYLTDLGVKWVQEMPVGIKNVPPSIGIYSRVGREGGARPPGIDYDAYKGALRKTIERFKNRVKYWEVDTEPGGFGPPKGWKGHEEEYAIFLKETYGVIKNECPDCMVVLGGTAGIAGGRREDSNAVFVRKILDYGAGQNFDVFSFKLHHHKVSDYVDLKNKMEIYERIFSDRNLDLKKKSIFLETGIYDGNPKYLPGHPLSFIHLPSQTEFQQAAGLVKTYVYAIAHGVNRIFWNEVLERHNFGGEKHNPFNYYGLVNNPLNEDGKSHKKLAYYTYKKMVEVLEGSDWKNLVTVRDEGGIFIYKFNRQGKMIIVAWNDGNEESDIRIPGLKSSKIRITYAVPDKPSGLEVQDYRTSFKTFTVNVQENAIRMSIRDNPVYVEEIK